MKNVSKSLGFSLVEVMIVTGILGGLALVGMQITKTMTKTTVKASFDTDVLLITNEINGLLADPAKCLATFQNDATPDSINNAKYFVKGHASAPAQGYGGGNVEISSYNLAASTAPADPNVGVLTIAYLNKNILKGSAGATYITKNMNLYIEGTPGAITKCRALSTSASDIWTRGTGAYSDDIFYTQGNVGIGTTSPASLLTLNSSTPILRLSDSDTGAYSLINGNSLVGGLTISADTTASIANSIIGFQIDGAEKVRITESGQVGIGVTGPGNALDVRGAKISSGNLGAQVYVRDTTTFESTPTAGIGFVLRHGASSEAVLGGIHVAKENAIDGDRATYMSLVTTRSGWAPGEKVRITSMGRVGIGTNNPQASLHLNPAIGGAGMGPATSGTAPSSGIVSRFANTGGATLDFGMMADGRQWIQATNVTDQSFSYALGLNPNGGNVGIGTINPESALALGSLGINGGFYGLQIGKTNASTGFRFGEDSNNYADLVWMDLGNYINFRTKSTGTMYDNNLVLKNGNVGIGTTSPDSTFHAHKEFFGLNNLSAGHIQAIDLAVNADVYFLQKGLVGGYLDWGLINATAGGASKFYVRGDGNVGIGTTAPGYKLDVQGGDINASGSVRAAGVALTSDRRWKRNITPLKNSIEKLKQINGVSYDWAIDDYPDKQFSNKRQVGVVAQDIQAVFPELVLADKEGFLSVNYPALIAPLIEAFKAQQQQIEANLRMFKTMQGEMEEIKLMVTENKREIERVKAENAQLKAKDAAKDKEIAILKERLNKIEQMLLKK